MYIYNTTTATQKDSSTLAILSRVATDFSPLTSLTEINKLLDSLALVQTEGRLAAKRHNFPVARGSQESYSSLFC